MKNLLLVVCMASCLAAVAAEPEIGTIVAANDEPPKKSDITVSYDYDGKGKLILSIKNISMNASAKGVIGTVVINDGNILIQAKELYDARGPVESLRWYTVQYIIQSVQPARYILVHDDTATEGIDRISKTELDLTTAGKGSKTVTFKDPEDPLTKQAERNTEQVAPRNR